MDSNEANLLVVAGSGCYILKFRLTRLYLDVWWFDDVPLVSHIKFIFVMELTRWYSSFLANRCFDHSDLLNFMVWFSYFVVHLGFSDGYYVPSIVLYGFELDQFNDVRFFSHFGRALNLLRWWKLIVLMGVLEGLLIFSDHEFVIFVTIVLVWVFENFRSSEKMHL